MSADDYLLLTHHPSGGWTLVRGFDSDDEIPVATVDHPVYGSAFDALKASHDDPAEYGVRFDSRTLGPEYEQAVADADEEWRRNPNPETVDPQELIRRLRRAP